MSQSIRSRASRREEAELQQRLERIIAEELEQLEEAARLAERERNSRG